MNSDFSQVFSLKTRVTLCTLIIFLVGIWSLAYYAGRVLHDDLQRLVGEQQFSTASIVAADVNQELDFRLKALEKIAEGITPNLLSNPLALQRLLKERPLLQNLFNGGYFITNVDGTAMASMPLSANRTSVNFMDRDHIISAIKNGKTTVSKPVIGKMLHTPVFSMAAPIRGKQGSVIGALAGVIDLNKPNFLDKITAYSYGKTGGYILIAPQHKLIVTATDKSRIMQPLPAPGINLLFDRYVQGFEGSGCVVDSRGLEVLSAARQIPAAGWILVARIPAAEAFAPIFDMQKRMKLVAIILSLLAGGLTWWMLRCQLSPMLAAVKMMSSIADSDLPVTTLPIKRRDEVGQLISAFNRLLETLAEREVKLSESAERHRSILQTAINGICLIDTEGRLVEVNKAYCRMSGYSEHELLTMNIFDLEAQDSAASISKKMPFIKESGEANFESRHRRKDGIFFDIEVNAQYRPTNGGQFVVFLQDITERKLAAEIVRLNEARLKSLVKIIQSPAGTIQEFLDNALNEAISLTGSTIGYIYFYNEESREFVLNSWSNDVMKECSILNPQTRYHLDKTGIWGEAVRQRKPFILNDFQAESHLRKGYPEGHVHLGKFMTVPIFSNDRIVAVVGVANKSKDYDDENLLQLTLLMDSVWKHVENKRAEEALLKSENRLRTAQRIASIGNWELDLTNDKLVWSDEMYRIFENDPKEGSVSYEFFLKAIHPDDLEAVNRAYSESLIDKMPYEIVHRLLMEDGRVKYVLERCETFFDSSGYPLRSIGTVQDITRTRQAEEEKSRLESQLRQAQRMESVGRLAGGVAHDFNNMLTIISGYAQLGLTEVGLSSSLSMYFEEIKKTSERSADIIHQLLAFARKQIISPRILDINDTLAGMLKMLQRLIGEDIHLNLQPAANIWPVKIDPSQIDQILANLCVNARDSINNVGNISIETDNVSIDENFCTNHVDALPGKYVRLAVSDNGSGMDKETLSQIFEPFFTTKEIGKGTGLGLSTVFGIVKQNNGFIEVCSELGKGTTFEIFLPSCKEEVIAPGSEDSSPPLPCGNETILMVEDELEILNVCEIIFSRLGYTALKANSPDEAIQLASNYAGEIQLVITDVVMPKMNGRELINKLHSLQPHLKCLFMSGYATDVINHHGVFDEGINFIQKPFSLPDMVIKVREVLDNKISLLMF